MAVSYLDLPGSPRQADELSVLKAARLATLVGRGDFPFVSLFECRRVDGAEIVVMDVEVEVPQRPVHDIRRHERIAVVFDYQDLRLPDVLALRADFPQVPHLNPRHEELPRSLCLYDQPYDELQLQWTAAGFVHRLREWLADTARGALHAPDQPLEPLLLRGLATLVLPPDWHQLVDRVGSAPFTLRAVDSGFGRVTLFVEEERSSGAVSEPRWAATMVRVAPQTHGIIRHVPRTLQELHRLLEPVGVDLLSLLQQRLHGWRTQHPTLLAARLIVIVALPKLREHEGTVEEEEVRAFVTEAPIQEVGIQLGYWGLIGGHIGLLVGEQNATPGNGVAISSVNCTELLTRERASSLNGTIAPDDTRITAIGLGTLGSQVFLNALHAGVGCWTLIDKDYLQPHNLARYPLSGLFIGYPKVEALRLHARTILPEEDTVSSVVADVLHPGPETEAVHRSLAEANVVLDMSASVAVARYLARDVTARGRGISLFLNPSGTDLVLLAEDAARLLPLDLLEMQYYRHLLGDPVLEQHLQAPAGRIRYAQSCRDVSSTIAHEMVALLGGVGIRALRQAMQSDQASIRVWQVDPETLQVRHIPVPPVVATVQRVGSWTVCMDQGLRNKLLAQRAARLPAETGGVLLGAFDTMRQIVYIVDGLPSPPDSVEWPTCYIRGYQGLSQQLADVQSRTMGMLGYVGEWHSHPPHCSCSPSTDDRQVFTWLAEHMALEDLPPVMLIVGDQQLACYVEQMP